MAPLSVLVRSGFLGKFSDISLVCVHKNRVTWSPVEKAVSDRVTPGRAIVIAFGSPLGPCHCSCAKGAQ